MDILPLQFRTLTYCGYWNKSDSNFNIFKGLWGFFISAVIFYFTLTQVIELYLLRNNVEDLVDVMFLTVTYIVLCIKIINFNFRRKDLSKLLDDFRDEICQPESKEEKNILEKYTTKIKKIFQVILSLSQATGVFFCILPFVTLTFRNYELPFKTFQFYDDTTFAGFSVTYFIQFIALIFGIFINVSMDTMAYGFIMLASSQFEMISYRLIRTVKVNDKELLRKCVAQHMHVYGIVRKIQKFFIGVIAPLFLLSLLTLCASIFQMSQNEIISLEFLGFAMYLSCMLCQIFLYCWYGNELKIKSEDVANDVYKSDWTSLDLPEKKILRTLMLFAQKDSTISWQGQCTLSLNTFVWIMKTSYTAFNLLQRVNVNGA